MAPVGENSEAPAFTGEVQGRRGWEVLQSSSKGPMARRSDPTTEAEKALEGRTPGGKRLRAGFGLSRYGLSGVSKALKTACSGGV
jgi:hypothetical protein